MDFLDPQKQKAHARRLALGYLLIGAVVILATTILLYRSYGFVLNKNGQIVQQGLVFVSSSPNPANLYINNLLNGTTNKRVFLEAGSYTFRIDRDGYRQWQRAVTVDGGSVEHFDYPFLFPTTLTSSPVKSYTADPAISTQSPSRQWLLVQSASAFNKFDEYDLSQKQATGVISNETIVTVPSNVLTQTNGSQSWIPVEWSTDNTHLILKHTFQEQGQTASEYILLDRNNPQNSVNLTNTLGTNPSGLEFVDKSNYQNFYVYNQTTETLDTASLGAPAPQPFLNNVAAFYPYKNGLILYATTQGTPSGKVSFNLLQNGTTYPITQLPTKTGSQYLLNFTQYSGDWYVAVGVSTDNKVYVYRDPQAQLQAEPSQALTPVAILKVNNPSNVTFSSNAQFIMTEGGSGNSFAVYDAENEKSYAYTMTDAPLDAPQSYATWMDGDRITYVSAGKVVVFDFDGANEQKLVTALPDLLPVFDQNYRYLYTYMSVPANGSTPAGTDLEATSMLIPKDQ